MEGTIAIWLEDPRIEKEGDFYSAYNDQLQLVACGLSEAEATENLKGAIQTSCNALLKDDILFETLDKLNITYKVLPSQEAPNKTTSKPLLVGA